MITLPELRTITDSIMSWSVQKKKTAADSLILNTIPTFQASQNDMPLMDRAKFLHESLLHLHLSSKRNRDAAMILCQALLALRKPIMGEDSLSKMQVSAMIVLAVSYRNLEQQDSALLFGQKAHQYFDMFPSYAHHPKYLQLLVLLGNVYSDRDEPLKSITFQKQALALSKQQSKFNNAFTINFNLYNELLKLGNYAEALEAARDGEKCLALFKNEDVFFTIENKVHQGNALYYLEKLNASKALFDESSAILNTAALDRSDSLHLAFSIALGKSRLNQERRELYLQEAYVISKELQFGSPEVLRVPYSYLAVLLEKQKYREAIQIVEEVKPFVFLSNGTLRSYSFLSIFESSAAFAHAMIYAETQLQESLLQSELHLQRAIALEKERVGSKRKNTSFEIPLARQEYHPSRYILSAMGKLRRTRYPAEAQIQLMELYRASQMKSVLRKQDLAEILGVDQQILQREREINRNIAEIERKLTDTILQEPIALTLRGELVGWQQKQQAIEQKIKIEYPDYFSRAYHTETFDVRAFSAELASEETVIMYAYGVDSLVGCLIDEKGHYCTNLGLTQVIDSLIDQMSAGITLPHSKGFVPDEVADRATEQYQKSASQLFDILLLPFAERLKAHIQIIPERKLFSVPFPALLTEQPPQGAYMQSLPFAGRKYKMAISHSLELYQKQKSNAKKAMVYPYTWVGLAPVAEGVKSEHLLPQSGTEVHTLGNLMNGSPAIGVKADKAFLQARSKDAEVLHIATHAITHPEFDKSDFMLLANAEPITTQEIAALDIKSRFCFLASCNTGRGATTAQEGSLGMSRAFALAGSPCILATLWPVDDQISLDFATRFYTYLKSGKTVEQSLHDTQMDFIQGTTSLASPFFWAGYTITGDASLRLSDK